jgi:putative ABC transport system permease protein
MNTTEWMTIVRRRLNDAGVSAPPDALVEEIAEHLAERYEDAVKAGIDAERARAAAVAEIDDLRAVSSAATARRRPDRRVALQPPTPETPCMWTDLRGDLRFAARLLLRRRGFTIAAVLTIAVGIGATTAILGVVDAVLVKPLPYPEPDRLVAVWETDRDSGTIREPASLPDVLDLREQSRRVRAFGGVIPDELNLTPPSGEPRRLACLYVSSDLLPMLGARPVEGRLFSAAEHAAGRDDVVVISARMRAQIGEAEGRVVGRTLRLDDGLRTVVGILPDSADTGMLQWLAAADYGRGFADRDARTRVDLWLPMPTDVEALPRDTHPVLTLGRLASGVSLAEARDEVGAIMTRLERAHASNKARGAHLEPFPDVVLGRVRPALWALLAAAVVVLVVACGNVANLLLVRGTSRVREVAVRSALGAARRRLMRQFMVENGVLAALGGALGLAISFAIVRLLVALAPPDVPRLPSAGVGGRVLAAAFVLTALVALAFGLVPVLQARRLDLARALAHEGSRAQTGAAGLRRVRAGLVIGEVALAFVVTVGAGLMVRTVLRLQAVDPGFDVQRVLKAEFQLPAARYPRDFRRWPDFAEMHRFNAALLDDVRRLPGVQAAALAGSHPLDAGFTNSFVVVGREAEGRDWPEIAVRRLTPGYFATLRVPLVRGRLLQERDDTAAPPVALVNEAAAARFFGASDPLGHEIRFWGSARRIVGIVGNERFQGLATPPPPAVYTPLAQTPSAAGAEVLLVRTSSPESMGGALRAAIHRNDPALAVFGEEPLATTLAETTGQRRFVMLLLATFAGATLILAALGLYAVLSYDVAQRQREIGIRLALGALPSGVRRLVLWRATLLAAAGLVAGALASIALTRLIRGLLFEVAPGDITTLVATAGALALVALAASYVPARRIARTDPAAALRQE